MRIFWFIVLSQVFFVSITIGDDVQVTGAFIESTVNTALSIFKKGNVDSKTKEVEIRKLAHEMFDIPYMAGLVLGRRHRPKFNKEQQEEFTHLFLRQLEASYFNRMNFFLEASFEYGEPYPFVKTGYKTKYRVPSYIDFRNQRYEMIYKLHQVKSLWRVYDVEVDGISVIKMYKNQYDQFLQNMSSQELIETLQKKDIELPFELKEKKLGF